MTVQTMFSRLFANDPRLPGMDYGFSERILLGQPAIGHGGTTRIFSPISFCCRSFISASSSRSQCRSRPARDRFAELVLAHYLKAPPVAAVLGPAQDAAAFVGSYVTNRYAQTNFEKLGLLFGGAESRAPTAAN